MAITQSTGCITLSDNFAYAIVALHPGTDTDIGLVVFPQPANKQFNVVFVAKTADKLTLSLINSAGAIAYTKTQDMAAGNFSTIINVANLSPGTYVLKAVVGTKVYAKKVLIIR